MDWTAQVDGYCERLGPGFWAEPVNALTNLAFLVAAVWMWRRSAGVAPARLLAAVLFAIGLGSFLFHTTAQVWAGVADTAPIAVFILTYLFLVNRDVLGWPGWFAGVGTALFLPYASVVTALLGYVPFLRISGAYWTVPLLIGIYAFLLRDRLPRLAAGMTAGALILVASITFRTFDSLFCTYLPLGTHFLWHLLNALMLGWMIEVYRRFRMGE